MSQSFDKRCIMMVMIMTITMVVTIIMTLMMMMPHTPRLSQSIDKRWGSIHDDYGDNDDDDDDGEDALHAKDTC